MGRLNEMWTVIAANNSEVFVEPKVLCVSPVLKGWIEEPETRHPVILRREGFIDLSGWELDIVNTVVAYLKTQHDLKTFKFRPDNLHPIFFARVYKLALNLGLEGLCLETLRDPRFGSCSIEDFIDVASCAEPKDIRLLDGEQFRGWFSSYVEKNQDKLLNLIFESKIQKSGKEAEQLLAMFVSALAATKADCERLKKENKRLKEDIDQRQSSWSSVRAITPASSPPNRNGASLNARRDATHQRPQKRKKYAATVEDDSGSD